MKTFLSNLIQSNFSNSQQSSEFADDIVEAQPLWEYPNKALGLPKTVFSIDFTNVPEESEQSTELTLYT